MRRDRPHLAYCNRFEVVYASSDGGEWSFELVAEPQGDGNLGQLVALALDSTGRAHVAYYELPRNSSNSLGTVYYAAAPSSEPTAVADGNPNEGPDVHSLEQNFPNPFNPATTIRFRLPQDGFVDLSVYDVAGQLLRSLERDHRQAGSYRVTWDGRDGSGNDVATGIYFSRLRTGSVDLLGKMLLVR